MKRTFHRITCPQDIKSIKSWCSPCRSTRMTQTYRQCMYPNSLHGGWCCFVFQVGRNLAPFFSWALFRIGLAYLRVCIFDLDWLGNACTRICFFIYFWWRIDLPCWQNQNQLHTRKYNLCEGAREHESVDSANASTRLRSSRIRPSTNSGCGARRDCIIGGFVQCTAIAMPAVEIKKYCTPRIATSR